VRVIQAMLIMHLHVYCSLSSNAKKYSFFQPTLRPTQEANYSEQFTCVCDSAFNHNSFLCMIYFCEVKFASMFQCTLPKLVPLLKLNKLIMILCHLKGCIFLRQICYAHQTWIVAKMRRCYFLAMKGMTS
jgi:hypothetical protein